MPSVLPENKKPKHVVVPLIDGGLTIDGQLDDKPWKKAPKLTPFYLNDGSKAESETTTVRVLYDKTYLYLAWTCIDSNINATMTERDSNLWEEEVAEFFVTPHDPTRYFELQWNPLGTIFDAIITNTLDEKGFSKSIKGDRSWHASNMKSAVVVDGKVGDDSVKDKEWRVEVAIPFADLNLDPPAKGDTWRGNFYRYNRTTGQKPELVSWSPTLTRTFHEPKRFGFIEFGG